MKKLIQLRGSVCGTHSHKIYTLISIDDTIYVFIVSSYDNSIEIRTITKDDYVIGKNITLEVIKDPHQFKYHDYESFVSIWRANIIKEPVFMHDNYYTHLLQIEQQKEDWIRSHKSIVDEINDFYTKLKL